MDAEIFGTTFLVDKTWYLRFATGGGVLVPLTCSSSVDHACLRDGAAVRTMGRLLQDHRGCSTGVYISSVETIGASK